MKLNVKICYLIAAAAIVSGLFIPAGSLSAQSQPVIILYGSEKCGFCNAMKRNLDAEKIAYTFHDINNDKTKGSEMWKKVYSAYPDRKGGVVFPVMDISGKILISPKFEEVKSLLGSGDSKKETDGSSAEKKDENRDLIVIPDQNKDKKFLDIQDIRKSSVIFQNKYYKTNVWDAQRLPASPVANKNWRLLGFKNPYEIKTRTYIDWGKADDRFLAFDIEEDENDNPSSIADDIFNSGKKYRMVLNLFEGNGTKVKTVSDWGRLLGFGSVGFMYVQEGTYGTMFTNIHYKVNNSLTYKPDLASITKLSEIAEYGYKPDTAQ